MTDVPPREPADGNRRYLQPAATGQSETHGGRLCQGTRAATAPQDNGSFTWKKSSSSARGMLGWSWRIRSARQASLGRSFSSTTRADLPYQKPPLSKDFLKGDGRNPLMLKAEVFYTQNSITLLRGRRAVAIDRAAKLVRPR